MYRSPREGGRGGPQGSCCNANLAEHASERRRSRFGLSCRAAAYRYVHIDRFAGKLVQYEQGGHRGNRSGRRAIAGIMALSGDGRGEEWMDLGMRIDRLEEALTRLAQAQARTEERVAGLEERVTRLEDAVIRLAEAQARTDARVADLAQAVLQLTQQVGQLAQQVGRLGEVIGFTLEDLAREVAPAYLAQHHNIHIQLDRRFFSVDGEDVEVDLYGEGEQDGKAIVVIGEVRSRIHGRDVQSAARQAARLRPQLPVAPLVVLFGFVIHPSARDTARQLDAIVISSSGRPERS
jgi:predicted nuclease with TOPRIM domain